MIHQRAIATPETAEVTHIGRLFRGVSFGASLISTRLPLAAIAFPSAGLDIRNAESSLVVTDKFLHPTRNLIAYSTEQFELPILGRGSRIFEAVMDSCSTAMKDWARFLCVIAYSNHIVELLSRKLDYRLRAVTRNVDTDLGHCLHGIRIQSDRLGARAKSVEVVSRHLAQQALSHLATCGIFGAKDQDSLAHRTLFPYGSQMATSGASATSPAKYLRWK